MALENLFQKFEKVFIIFYHDLKYLGGSFKHKGQNSKRGHRGVEFFEEVMNKTMEILSGEILKTGAIIKSDFSKLPKIDYKFYLFG